MLYNYIVFISKRCKNRFYERRHKMKKLELIIALINLIIALLELIRQIT